MPHQWGKCKEIPLRPAKIDSDRRTIAHQLPGCEVCSGKTASNGLRQKGPHSRGQGSPDREQKLVAEIRLVKLHVEKLRRKLW